jgi:hypothetical protein
MALDLAGRWITTDSGHHVFIKDGGGSVSAQLRAHFIKTTGNARHPDINKPVQEHVGGTTRATLREQAAAKVPPKVPKFEQYAKDRGAATRTEFEAARATHSDLVTERREALSLERRGGQPTKAEAKAAEDKAYYARQIERLRAGDSMSEAKRAAAAHVATSRTAPATHQSHEEMVKRNSINESETILRAGHSNGRRIGEVERAAITRQVAKEKGDLRDIQRGIVKPAPVITPPPLRPARVETPFMGDRGPPKPYTPAERAAANARAEAAVKPPTTLRERAALARGNNQIRAAQEEYRARQGLRNTLREQAAKGREARGLTGEERVGRATAIGEARSKPAWMYTKAELAANRGPYAPNNSMTPWSGKTPVPGTWNADERGDLEEMRRFRTKPLKLSENEEEGRRGEEYPHYVQWAKEGKQPPPITVVRKVGDSSLSSINRRRVLAARDAGNKHIEGWFGDTDMATGRPRFTHEAVVADAVRRGLPVPEKVLDDYPHLRALAPAKPTTARAQAALFTARATTQKRLF